MMTITRRIHFDAAHRVVDHESKCKYLHGHRYVIDASFTAEKLDKIGRIIDFGVIKERLGSWIDTHWDHTTILWEKDRALGEEIEHLTGQTIFYLPHNPTVEHLADYLMKEVCQDLFLGTGVTCTHIRIYETPNGYVDIEA